MKLNKQIVKSSFQAVRKVIDKNSPKILAAMGIGFGIGSVAFTVRGTIKAVEIVREKKAESEEELTKTEIIKCVWKEYIPTVGLGVASIACVIGSVHISARRLAVMTAAYTMSDESFKKYRDKVHEVLGDKKEEEIRGEIQQDYIDANPPKEMYVTDTETGDTLCLDAYTGQYFRSNADTIRRAINTLNNLMLHDYFVCYNDLASELGIEQCRMGENFGWNVQNGDLIEPSFTTELTPEDEPVLVLDFIEGPKPDFKHYL